MCALSKFVIYHWMWEQLWHRAVCINEEQDRKRHPSDTYPSSCLAACLWHCEMERKAWSKMRCKHVCSMNSCFGMELFKDERTFFCQLSRCMSSDLKRLTPPPPHFLSLAAFFSSFFSSTLTFWVSIQEEASSICQKHRETSGQGIERLFVKVSLTGEF